jgi:hypothetical protein
LYHYVRLSTATFLELATLSRERSEKDETDYGKDEAGFGY